jgi:uncharacterized cupredoxin-like copper-binding protein
MSKSLVIAVIAVVTAVSSACDTASSPARHDAHTDSGTHADRGAGSRGDSRGDAFGEPAAQSAATRTIPIVASDELQFDPSSIEVEVGDVVTFVVKNVGKTDHELVLGDAAYQQQHETDMRDEHDHMSEVTKAVTVHPGKTARLTWRFSETGEVLFGCHEPGHYAGGMVGTIHVT